MSMSTKHAVGWLSKAEIWIADDISEAELYGLTHDEMIDKVNKSLSRLPKSTPQWVRSKAFYYFQILARTLYQDKVRWQLYLDGVRVGDKDVPSGRWQDVTGRHEWTKSGKPYSTIDKVDRTEIKG